MASGGQQPEAFSMVDFDGKHAELVQKLSEISTSMRQCADIVDSFNQIVRHLSPRHLPFELGPHRHTPGPGIHRPSGYPRPERTDAHGTTGSTEAAGPAHATHGAEVFRRPSYPHVGGSMLPPAVPTYQPSGTPHGHSSSSSPMHPMSGPSSYSLQRTGSATSTTGPAGPYETSALGPRTTESEIIASERPSPSKPGKRKRTHQVDPAEHGDDSDDDTGTGASPQEIADAPSETDEATRRSRRPAYGSEGSSEASRKSSRGQTGVEGVRTEDRLAEMPSGPSIVVFASGTGTARPRAPSTRGPGQASSSRARKEKKPRDPNAPKQPAPAYIVYQNEIRETMRARFPGHSPTELVKEIAATWKTLPNSERQRYKDQANVEKDRWVAELAAYQATLSTADESQPAKSSEGAFLPLAGVSDSPPGSPRQSPRMSDTEGDSHDVRRVASQDAPSSSTTYGYAYQAPLRASSSFPGPSSIGGIAGTGSPRPGVEAGYPPRVERPHSRLASSTFGSYGRASPLHIPSPPPSRTQLAGLHPDSRGTSTRLPGLDSLGLGHGSSQPTGEPSPRPPREHGEREDEPASKRQRTRVGTSGEGNEGDNGFSHLTYEERKSE
ncbi:HMG (high mobility group) box protein [Ceratobasidium sp. AG-Ba]|nr:HMG (high mobility group) box protein [Ceratobasidium sp. AG-Ba]